MAIWWFIISALIRSGTALLVGVSGGTLTRLGHEQYLDSAMSLGVFLIFMGYLKTIQPPLVTAVAAVARFTTAGVQS